MADQTGGTIFQHGVASGDPLADRVVIWTRVTTEDGSESTVTWWLEDAADERRRLTGTITALADRDWTVHVDVEGLEAGHRYRYGFEANGEHSEIGRTRTLPTDDVSRLRFGQVSCAKFNAGFFNAFSRLAERDDLDAIIHLGDTIYEASNTPPKNQTPGADIGRPFDPLHECKTLDDYRRRYRQYRTDPDIRAAHAAHPFICTLDDHEFADGAWRDGADNHDEERDGPWAARKADAFRARSEWLPLRPPDPSDPSRTFRTVRFGQLADLFLIDTRTRRDRPVPPPDSERPERTALGAAQKAWLFDELGASTATWRLLGNPSVMSRTWNDELPEPVKAVLLKVKLIDADGGSVGSVPAGGSGCRAHLQDAPRHTRPAAARDGDLDAARAACRRPGRALRLSTDRDAAVRADRCLRARGRRGHRHRREGALPARPADRGGRGVGASPGADRGHRPRLRPARHADLAAAGEADRDRRRCSATTGRRRVATASSGSSTSRPSAIAGPAIDAEIIELGVAVLSRRRSRRRRGPPQLDRRRGMPAGVHRGADGVLRGARATRCRRSSATASGATSCACSIRKDPAMAALNAAAPKVTDHLCEACAEHFASVRAHLDALGVPYRLEPGLVRGLDYYTRTAFEFYVTGREGQQQAIGGGGRYDGLVELLGGRPTPGHRVRDRHRPADPRPDRDRRRHAARTGAGRRRRRRGPGRHGGAARGSPRICERQGSRPAPNSGGASSASNSRRRHATRPTSR